MSNQFYERYWKKQDVLEDFSYKMPIIRKLLPENKPLIFLDFGCGKGAILKEITRARPSYKLFGTDISEKAIGVAAKRIRQGTFKKMTENQIIPYPDNFFDVILASDVLEHIYDTETAFTELKRTLKPKGQLVITVPFNGTIKVMLATLIAFNEYFHPYSPHIRFFSKSTLTWCLKQAGLQPVRVGYYGRFYPLSNGMYVVATK